MEKYYHFTSFRNLYNNIITSGLIPQHGLRSYTIGDNRSGVFLSKGMDGAIVMMALIYGLYNKYNGYEGAKVIRDCEKGIIKDPVIYERACLARRIKTFDEYLGLPGCYLSINNVKRIDGDRIEDCVYKTKIYPQNISVVNLVNETTEEYINDVYSVLSYFMSKYSIDYILSLVPEENKKNIYDLYNYIRFLNIPDYSSYKLEEVPLYPYNNQIKTLSRKY